MRNFTLNTCLSAHFVKELFLGGLFTQFSLDSDGKLVIDQAAVRSVPAVQMAIDRINNKSDGIYDKLLPNTQVGCLFDAHNLQYFRCRLRVRDNS